MGGFEVLDDGACPPSAVTLAPDALPGAAESEATAAIPLQSLFHPGDVLDDTYEVRGKIGQGGMGEVYEAYDRALCRRVAIKAAVPGIMPGSIRKEARALAALRDPGIVAVHGVGEHAGVSYVVMECVPGKTLEAHLAAHRVEGTRLAFDEIRDILVGIAGALSVVHRAGMAHCDVKPANVMLAPRNRVVLTDFGIFQAEIDVTNGVARAGSPNYMAPEAIAATVDPGDLYLVDVYALGIVAFELLTGVVPYDHREALRVCWMHVSAPVPNPQALRPDTPPRLVRLVRDMLAKDPNSRPQSMEEVAWQLRHLQAEPPRPCGSPVWPMARGAARE
jgi:serine/threonine-protein kinase